MHNSAWIQLGSCDIAHFFNKINYGDAPYVATFESVLPRYYREQTFAVGVKELVKDSCRKALVGVATTQENLSRLSQESLVAISYF